MNLVVEFLERCMPGQRSSGDAAFVHRCDDWTLFSVIDGLGHGDKAHEAAEAAVQSLAATDPQESIHSIMRRLDAALRSTRGAAATVCVAEGNRLYGCGVGNVEVRSRHTSIPWVLTPGILGRGVRNLRCFEGTLEKGARIVLFSDGISCRFSLSDLDDLSPRGVCDALLSRHGKDNDDATSMVVEFGG